MALKNTTDGSYLRVLYKDKAKLDLVNKVFYCELSEDKPTRESPTIWNRQKTPKFNVKDVWELDLDDPAVKLIDIPAEVYRCIKTTEEFGPNSDWVNA